MAYGLLEPRRWLFDGRWGALRYGDWWWRGLFGPGEYRNGGCHRRGDGVLDGRGLFDDDGLILDDGFRLLDPVALSPALHDGDAGVAGEAFLIISKDKGGALPDSVDAPEEVLPRLEPQLP